MDVHPPKNVSIGIDPYPYHIHFMWGGLQISTSLKSQTSPLGPWAQVHFHCSGALGRPHLDCRVGFWDFRWQRPKDYPRIEWWIWWIWWEICRNTFHLMARTCRFPRDFLARTDPLSVLIHQQRSGEIALLFVPKCPRLFSKLSPQLKQDGELLRAERRGGKMPATCYCESYFPIRIIIPYTYICNIYIYIYTV